MNWLTDFSSALVVSVLRFMFILFFFCSLFSHVCVCMCICICILFMWTGLKFQCLTAYVQMTECSISKGIVFISYTENTFNGSVDWRTSFFFKLLSSLIYLNRNFIYVILFGGLIFTHLKSHKIVSSFFFLLIFYNHRYSRPLLKLSVVFRC